jgi:lipid II:glycine glycyltransferase (peptidoglycan interpeptide bridge formation enzyme)
MASNLMMWEAIKFGKKLGLKKFDMWGSMGPNADIKDHWYGFHRFKEGYGPKLTEFVGSYDFVINKKMYFAYKLLNRIRWVILRLK